MERIDPLIVEYKIEREELDPEEQAYVDLDQMFKEYDLSEYEKAWEIFKGYFERVCRENREMRKQLEKVKFYVA